MKKLFSIIGILIFICAVSPAQEAPHYNGFAIGTFITNQYATGEWSKQTAFTLGGGVDLEYTLPLELSDNLGLGLSEHIDYTHIFPKEGGNLKNGNQVSVDFGVWLRIPFMLGELNLAFQPEIGYSLIMHNIEGKGNSGIKRWYPDQAIVISPAFRWIPNKEGSIFELDVSPVYTAVFEKDYVLNQLGFRLGGVWHIKK